MKDASGTTKPELRPKTAPTRKRLPYIVATLVVVGVAVAAATAIPNGIVTRREPSGVIEVFPGVVDHRIPQRATAAALVLVAGCTSVALARRAAKTRRGLSDFGAALSSGDRARIVLAVTFTLLAGGIFVMGPVVAATLPSRPCESGYVLVPAGSLNGGSIRDGRTCRSIPQPGEIDPVQGLRFVRPAPVLGIGGRILVGLGSVVFAVMVATVAPRVA